MLSMTTLNPDHSTLFARIGELAASGDCKVEIGICGWGGVHSVTPWLVGRGDKNCVICRGVDKPVVVGVFICCGEKAGAAGAS